MIRAIIFDLDGVLLSTDRFHYLGWKMMCDRHHIPFDESVNDLLRGVSRMASLEIILDKAGITGLSQEEKEAMATEKNDTYRQLLAENITPQIVDPQVLDALKARDILLAIGSSSKNTGTIIDLADLRRYFDAVVDGTMISRSKPDPEVFLKAAQALAVSPAEAIVVEDAIAGIQAAKAGGFYAYAIKDAVNCPLADHRTDGLTDLLELVE